MERTRLLRAYAIAVAAWIFSMILAMKIGATDDVAFEIIAQLRLPRAVLATAVGMGLAVAGATLQAIFTNPLCEPYTLGVSSGSALGAVIATTFGLQTVVAGLAGSSFIGAFVFSAILYLVSLRAHRGNLTLLLAGVMLGFVGSSLVALWMALADPNGIQGVVFWLLGDLSRARASGSLFTLGSVILLSTLIWSRSRQLDALLMGEEGAVSLGVSVSDARRRLILLSSFLTGVCVSGAGMIGFVGLVVPHFARRFVGSLHTALLPLVAIWGATTLVLADLLARVIARPYEVPVGVVTALLGAPIFLWVILQRRDAA